MSRAEQVYKNSPRMKRDEETGKMGVGHAEAETEEVDAGTNGMKQPEEGVPTHIRHSIERREVHNRHESEHMIHDHSGMPKEKMHARHLEEHKAMHKRHEKEHMEMHGKHESKKEHEPKKEAGGEKKAEKIEHSNEEGE